MNYAEFMKIKNEMLANKFVELCQNNEEIRAATEEVAQAMTNPEALTALTYAVSTAYFTGLENGHKTGYHQRIVDEIKTAQEYEFAEYYGDEDEEEEEED